MIQNVIKICFTSSNCTQNQKFKISQLHNIVIEIVPLRLSILPMLLNLKKLVKFTCNTIDMGTRDCQKQSMFSKVGCCVVTRTQIQFSSEYIFPIILCFVYFVCSFNIFHFYIISVSLLYVLQIYKNIFIRVGKVRGVFRTQWNI